MGGINKYSSFNTSNINHSAVSYKGTTCKMVEIFFYERGNSIMETFQAISLMFAFGLFILTLLNYIEKRK